MHADTILVNNEMLALLAPAYGSAPTYYAFYDLKDKIHCTLCAVDYIIAGNKPTDLTGLTFVDIDTVCDVCGEHL